MNLISNIGKKGRLMRSTTGIAGVLLVILFKLFFNVPKTLSFVLIFVFSFVGVVGLFQGATGFCVMHGLKGDTDHDMKAQLENSSVPRVCPLQTDQKSAKTILSISIVIAFTISVILTIL